MAYAAFSQFLSALEKTGDLKRIDIPVSTDMASAEGRAAK
jgi:3-polyprenyl-4-hydroxybenzoate decarboxylase